MSDAETLQKLRKRACQTEVLGTLRSLADAASELAGIAEESLLLEIADFQDRLAAKIERLGGTAVPRRSKTVAHNGAGISPQVRTIIGPWTVDEFGNQSRQIYADPDGPPMRL
jgi:hypothetical protein